MGKNVTRCADILRTKKDVLKFDDTNQISLIEHDRLSYLPRKCFIVDRNLRGMSARSVRTAEILALKYQKRLIDKVHSHIYGRAEFSDYQIRLECNGLWFDSVHEYLKEIIAKCPACRATSNPQPSRKVAISTLWKDFNEILSIDHFYLDDMCLLHCVDTVTCYFTVHLVESAKMRDAVTGIEASWFTQFWCLQEIQGNLAFDAGKFKTLLHFQNAVPTRSSSKACDESD